MATTYRTLGVDPLLWPRLAGSWPGATFTAAPLGLPAGQFGLGTAAAPTRRTSTGSSSRRTPRSPAWTARRSSFVELFYALA